MVSWKRHKYEQNKRLQAKVIKPKPIVVEPPKEPVKEIPKEIPKQPEKPIEPPKTNKNANKTYSKYNALLDEVDSDETDDLNLNLNSLPTLYQLKLNNFKNKNIIYKSDLVKSKLKGSMPINNKNIDQEKGILTNIFSIIACHF
jgi:hypothetical protein